MSQELDEIRQILTEQSVIINRLEDRVDMQTERICKLEYLVGELSKKLEVKVPSWSEVTARMLNK